jgi:purine-cytosine permease-like protein
VVPFLVRIPRVIFVMVYTVVVIPVAISAAKSFFASLENFIYLIAYWSAGFVGVVAMEHFVFRKADCANYVIADWNTPSKLPTGIAAIGAIALAFGLVVPCMSQVWFTGPLAKTTGDIGFEVALVLAPILYYPLRSVELKYRGV